MGLQVGGYCLALALQAMPHSTTVQCSENYEEKGTPPKPQKRNRNPKRREANHGHRIEAALIDTDTRGKLLIGQLTPKRLTMDELIPQLDLSEFF